MRRIFHIGQGQKTYRFSVNFLRFPGLFERDKTWKLRPFLFAPLRLRVNHLQPHGARRGLIYFTQRREGAKGIGIAVR